MQKIECTSCRKPKANLECGLCHSALCKSCTQFVDEDTFSFLAEVPTELSHTTYCHSCHEQTVVPALVDYNQLMEQAKEIAIYFHNQGKETRLMSRKEDPVSVKNCLDRDETILRLAFYATQKGYNSLVDVKVDSEKIKEGSRQKMIWHGSGVPTQVTPDKII